MPVYATLLALSFLTHLTGQAADRGGPVVGLWLAEAVSKGGLGSWLEVRADGTASVSFGALVEGTYTMEGTSLRIVFPRGKERDGTAPETMAVEMRINGNSATRIQPAPADVPPENSLTPDERAMLARVKRPVEMTRVGAPLPDAAAIVGTWSYAHYTGGAAYEVYTPGGRMVLMVAIQHWPATYSGKENALTLHLSEGTATVVVTGDVLTLVSPDGQSSTYRRAPR